jgi:hypothetical protein
MDIPFRTALEKALGIAIGMMAIELLARLAFNLSVVAEIVDRLSR